VVVPISADVDLKTGKADAAVDLARRHAVEMPIAGQMYQMLHFGLDPREAIQRLMERSLKGE